jgi:tetratricopeptide (TPR) repeat protein
MGMSQDRIEQFKKVLETDPNDEVIRFGLGKLYAEAGKHAEAVEQFREVLRLKPEYSAAYLEMAKSLRAIQRTGEANAILVQGLEIAERKGDLHVRNQIQALLGK